MVVARRGEFEPREPQALVRGRVLKVGLELRVADRPLWVYHARHGAAAGRRQRGDERVSWLRLLVLCGSLDAEGRRGLAARGDEVIGLACDAGGGGAGEIERRRPRSEDNGRLNVGLGALQAVPQLLHGDGEVRRRSRQGQVEGDLVEVAPRAPDRGGRQRIRRAAGQLQAARDRVLDGLIGDGGVEVESRVDWVGGGIYAQTSVVSATLSGGVIRECYAADGEQGRR